MTCPSRVSSDSLKIIADTLTASCEDSDPKVRDMCVKTFIIVADVIKSRGRGAIEAHNVVMKLEQSIPKVFKKIRAMKEGGGCDTSAVTTATTSVILSTSSTTTVSKPPTGLQKPQASSQKAGISSTANKKVSSDEQHHPPSLMKSKSTSGAKGSASSSASSKAQVQQAGEEGEVEELTMSPEEAIDRLTEIRVPDWQSIQT